MKKIALILAMVILTGCMTSQPTQPPAPAQPTKQEPAPQQPATPVVPTKEEICIKPEDQSGITIDLYKPQGHSTFRAKPGWVISRPSMQLLGAVRFPRAVDPASVKISVDPAAGYQSVEQQAVNAPDTLVLFNFMPADADKSQPLVMQWGKPGWVTLTVEGAKDKQGKPLQEKPLTLKIFAYDEKMQKTHPYLVECYSSLSVPPGPGGH